MKTVWVIVQGLVLVVGCSIFREDVSSITLEEVHQDFSEDRWLEYRERLRMAEPRVLRTAKTQLEALVTKELTFREGMRLSLIYLATSNPDFSPVRGQKLLLKMKKTLELTPDESFLVDSLIDHSKDLLVLTNRVENSEQLVKKAQDSISVLEGKLEAMTTIEKDLSKRPKLEDQL